LPLAFEVDAMLKAAAPVALTEVDQQVFQAIVPPDHYLRQVRAVVDFESFRPRLNAAYSLLLGRPPIDPVRMLKILFLRFHYRLSDRQVMARTVTDLAFRWFLDLGLHDTVPDHTNGTHFRQRIGAERFQQVFQDLVTLAREHGLVSDRLRLKDATHLFADVARIQPVHLVAQVRERLLAAAQPLFPAWVSQQRTLSDQVRQATAELPENERLAQRVELLRQMALAVRQQLADLPAAPAQDQSQRQRLERALAVVTKLLADRADPEAGDGLVSALDPDARVGKHGQFFVGYLLDVALDAHSEIITAVNVLPGNGAEAADAVTLVRQEEAAQGNDVEGLSMDGVGYNGPVLRELTDPEGLNLDVTVPPPPTPERKTFGPERFTLHRDADGVAVLTCPAGQTTRPRQHNADPTGTKYLFKPEQCAACPLRAQCLQNPASQGGRTVFKNHYQAEYDKVQAKAATAAYQQTRRTHPKIERKLGELARHHRCRRASYRGQPKVLSQALLTAFVVNVKRVLHLLAGAVPGGRAALAVRAGLAGT
jgi:transposase